MTSSTSSPSVDVGVFPLVTGRFWVVVVVVAVVVVVVAVVVVSAAAAPTSTREPNAIRDLDTPGHQRERNRAIIPGASVRFAGWKRIRDGSKADRQ